MKFENHSTATNGPDFFDLMAQQMQGVHKPVQGKGDKAYAEALESLFVCIAPEKAAAAYAIDDAVGMLASETEHMNYKNGFADAICMILQAAMCHGR